MFTVHSLLSTVNTIFLPLLYTCFTSSQNSRMEFMIAFATSRLSSWKHCVTTTNNSLHESWTISQAKSSAKQHHIQNYFYADILTGEGEDYLTKFYTGRLRSEVQPLTLLYTIFDRKGIAFLYLPLKSGTSFTYLLKNIASLF